MKTISKLSLLALAAATLAGCAVVPAGPVYGPPVVAYAPPPVVVVRPVPRYYGYYGGRWGRYWR